MAISLASIQRSTALKAPKVVIYGVPGIGKTTWACGAPNPIVLQTEEGLGMIDAAHFPLATSYQDVLDAITALLSEEHDFQTVVLDSLDQLEPMLWRHVAERDGKAHIEEFGFGKGYAYAADEMRVLLSGLDALRDQRGMTVVVIAHSEVKRFESPEHEPYDRYQMRLDRRANDIVCEWADALLFANYRVHIVKDKGKFDKDGRARAAGRGERVLFTEQRPAFLAKNRYRLPPELPLAWEAFQNAIGQNTTAHDEPNSNDKEN